MEYSYDYSTNESSPIVTIIYLAIIVLLLVSYWKIFQKAGEAGWKSIVPLYNSYTMTKLVFSSGWFFLLALVPIANIVFAVMMCIRLAKAFGKGGGYAVGLIFLPFVFYPILAFNSSCVYLGNPAFGAGYGAGYGTGYNNMGGYPQQQGFNPGMQANNNYDPNNYYSSNQQPTPYTQQNVPQQNPYSQQNVQQPYGQNNYNQNNNGF